jgi:hypothetical protein
MASTVHGRSVRPETTTAQSRNIAWANGSPQISAPKDIHSPAAAASGRNGSAAAAFPITGAGGQYNPLEGDPVIRGWLQVQQYNQLNVLQNTMDVFVALTVPGDVEFGENPVDINVEADVLFSTLNTGTLV